MPAASPSAQKIKPTPESEKSGVFFEKFEQSAKTAVALAGGLYAVGLLISNLYLMSLGLSDFSSFRPKYIFTGLWVVLLFLLSFLGIVLPTLHWLIRTQDKLRVWIYGADAAVGLILSGMFMYLFVGLWGLTAKQQVKGTAMLVIFFHCIAALAFLITRYEIKPPTDIGFYFVKYIFDGLMFLVPCICFIVVATATYAVMPEALGGGKPVIANLLLTQEGMTFWKHTGTSTPDNAECACSGQVKILLQNDHELIVNAQYRVGSAIKHKIIIVDKKLVNGVVF